MRLTMISEALDKRVGFNYSDPKTPFYLLKEWSVLFMLEKDFGREKIWVHIPKGFKSDGCTLKLKLFRILLGCSHTPQYLPASLIHDYVLEHPELVGYDRNLGSRLLYTALLEENVHPFKAYLMYVCVDLYQLIKPCIIKIIDKLLNK